jgi:hypothetical protein
MLSGKNRYLFPSWHNESNAGDHHPICKVKHTSQCRHKSSKQAFRIPNSQYILPIFRLLACSHDRVTTNIMDTYIRW